MPIGPIIILLILIGMGISLVVTLTRLDDTRARLMAEQRARRQWQRTATEWRERYWDRIGASL